MAYSDKYCVVKFTKTNKPGIEQINAACSTNNGKKTLIIEVPNTSYLSKELLDQIPNTDKIKFRVAGPYDKYTFDVYKGLVFKSGEVFEESYFDGVIYTKDEITQIINKLEEIEMGINPYWSELQKSYYVYDYLRTQVTYNPDYLKEKQSTYNDRSLRGLIKGNTVCAGYSVIYKEILNRLGLDCACVLGMGHMWNAIRTKDGRVFPIDVTWGNTKLRKGMVNSVDYFAQDKDKFNQEHIPWSKERLNNYKYSELSKEEVKKIEELVTREKKFSNSTYRLERSDGSLFTLTQINNTTNGELFMYVYQDILDDNTLSSPKLIVTENNISKKIDTIRFYNGNPKPTADETKEYNETRRNLLFLNDYLFAKRNIKQSSNDKSVYLGVIVKNTPMNYSSLKKTLGTYKMEIINNKTTIYERKTNKVVTDERILYRVVFANAWLKAIGDIRNMDKYEYVYNHLLSHERDIGPITNVQAVYDSIDADMDNRYDKELAKQLITKVITKNSLGYINHSLCPMVYKRDNKKMEYYKTNSKNINRSDGTKMIVFYKGRKQAMPDKNTYPVSEYDIVEVVKDKNGKQIVKRNRIYTENDLLKDYRQEIADVLLSRDRLDKKVIETGSYIGYIGKDGQRYDNTKWVNHFEPSDRPSHYKVVDSKNKYTHGIDLSSVLVGNRSIVIR